MTQRVLAASGATRPSRQGASPPGIGRPATSGTLNVRLASPRCRFRAVGKSVVCSVGNCTGHPAQMAHVRDEEFGTPWASLMLCVALQDAAGRELSHRDPSTHGSVHGRTRGDDQPQPGAAELQRRSRAEQRRCA
jgi:hypothetical protein